MGTFDQTENVLEQLKSMANTETVIGKEFKLGEYTCVPVISVRIGFGSGGGEGDSKQGKGTGGGVGAGVNIEPIAFLVTRGEEISLMNIKKGKGMETLFEKMPEMMDKVSKFTSKKADKE
jgi:uncharacterized spore protein YtfJ